MTGHLRSGSPLQSVKIAPTLITEGNLQAAENPLQLSQ